MSTSPSGSVPEGKEFLNSFYIGIEVENILYGIELFLYFKTMRSLMKKRRKDEKFNLFFALFSSVMLFLVTVWVATQAVFGEKMWLIDANFPGGPGVYWKKYIAVWYIDWGTTAIVILQLMTDGIMIYRCRIIWNSNHVIVIPIILWLITFVFGVSVDWTTSLPGGDYFTGISTPLSLAYWSVSVFLTMSLTGMICYRVMQHGWMVKEHLGHEYWAFYSSTLAIIVESLLPYTFSGIAALVSLGVESPTSVIFVSAYFMMMCVSHQMVILRVVEGSAWGNDTFSRTGSTIKFGPGSASIYSSGSQWFKSGDDHVQALSNVYFPDARGTVRISEV